MDINRGFLKDTVRQEFDSSDTDQNKGIKPPPMEKPWDAVNQRKFRLVKKNEWTSIKTLDVETAIGKRRSRRKFTDKFITLEELSFLLWATQGVQRKFGDAAAYRTVPSAGARHAFETYPVIMNVKGLEKGLYRYLPLSHELLLEYQDNDISDKLISAALGQPYAGVSAVTFIWSVIPYRMEWRYGPASYKVLALDAGHVAQNLYIASESIGLGTCAIAAYDQAQMDKLIKADGNDEFVIYLAPVGRV
ncbi:MAG: thioester oxidase [Candidatus Firestonebacteria bacterium RIFOXYC2_FULL_39_67]|nr:MAG: thioester oxidase [Candidatus Firestonebacteria bacterium RIFOXYD2_FULL_39_29]OGF55404.1 MAG: thioester oxidase [Candidatus Firestonebacteria bacterium RIFOXYC2_FULL_39_67]